jgi:hypothetical protein
MKTLRYVIILLAGILWLSGCSREVMHQLYQVGFIPDDYRFGDLYRLSSLPQFKAEVQPCEPAPAFPDTARTHLFVLGDSFTEPGRLAKADLPVRSLRYFHWDHDLNRPIQLDTTYRNILLIESVERHLRQHVETPPTKNLIVVKDTTGTSSQKHSPGTLVQTIIAFIKSAGIEDRLETTLFSQDFFLWCRELKASLTLNWFDRYDDKKIALSHDGRAIFSELEVNNHANSAFTPLTDGYIDTLVTNLNAAAEHYRRAGFDEVMLSVIPNKVTLIDPAHGPGPYNRLLERVQHHPRLNVPIIDVYTPYRQSRAPLYELGDTHWNCAGRQIWLNELRKRL